MRPRRTVLAALVLAALVPAVALGTPSDVQDTGATTTATSAALEGAAAAGAGEKIDAIVHPLATVPTITDDPATIDVELDPDEIPDGADLTDPTVVRAHLAPSFGAADVSHDYVPVESETVESSVWPHRTVVRVTFAASDPAVGDRMDPVLHDLHLTGPVVQDTQPRAVEFTEAYRENPRFVVLADPQVGDGRAMEDGFRESQEEQSPEPFLDKADKVFGDGTADTRWKAFQRTVEEINLLDPDFVLVAGDLTLGQIAPGEYHVQYEDAYRIVNQIQAPTYLAMGNHDGYVQSGEDGYAFWNAYFGPLNYSVDYGDQAHIVSINTYDWDEMDRMAFSAGASTWGGQVQEDQLRWVQDDVASYRDRNPDGLVLTFSHHNPSWLQDDYRNRSGLGEAAARSEGVPAAEQITRGAATISSTGQGWTGDNRLGLRDVLRAADEGEPGEVIHFGGHTHRDRVARSVDGGHVVETTQKAGALPDGESARDLHYVHRDNTFDTGYTQEELRNRLQDWTNGPLFVDTTTASSSTNEYFGWRLVDLTPQDGAPGYELEAFGYPVDRAFLDEHANDPSFWNETHDALGLYSTPSFQLNLTLESGGPDAPEARATVRSDLAEAYEAVVPLTLDAGPLELVSGDGIAWQRTDGDVQDVGVAVTIPAEGQATAAVQLD